MIDVKVFHDETTGTFSYVVTDLSSNHCVVIDPVLDYDLFSACFSTTAVDKISSYIKTQNLYLQWILETHAHADHLTAAKHLQQCLGGKIGIGERITLVQKVFTKLFNLSATETKTEKLFDELFTDNQKIQLGNTEIEVMQTPGHTPACVSYKIGDVVFVGDTLFQPASGTARADFPGGDAHLLYQSIQRLLALPADTILYLCHDYPAEPNSAKPSCTVAEQRQSNIMANQTITEAEFVAKRIARDKTLNVPALFYPALQVNIMAGTLPPLETNGIRYLKIPLNQLAADDL